jgi:hypothetical protein
VSPAADPRIGRLPDVVRPLAAMVGYDQVERLLVEFGGQQIYIPSRPLARQQLWRRCGPELAHAMAQLFGRTTLKVPLGRGLRTRAKHQAICKDPRSANQVAADYGMHVDSVHRIRAGRPADPKQGDLFQAQGERDG